MKGIKKILSITMIAAILCSFSIGASAVESSASPTATTVTAEQAVDAMLSEGMSAENINLTAADNKQLGYFKAPNDMKLPFDEGIVLSTGYANGIFTVNDTSTSLSGSGNSYLTEIYQSDGFSEVTYDAVELSFDLVPTKAALTFDFFFASTEYDQPKQYNDTFALWVIDSETGERFNIAKTPFGKVVNVQNTVTKDGIGNMLYTDNSKYYNAVLGNNYNGYDFGMLGVSTMFSADAASLKNSKGEPVIQSGKKVTLSFAIADSADHVMDSAIFIRSNSVKFEEAVTKEYTVTFDANGGSCDVENAKTGTDGTLESLPLAVMDGNYTFDGWYTKPSGGEKIDVSTVFEADTTVYAHWKAAEYTIKFDVDGGDEIGDMIYNSESTDVIPAANKNGFTFEGWQVVSGDGNWNIDEVVAAGTSVNGMYGNLTLKAIWKENPTEPQTTVSVPQTTQPTQPTTKAQATVDESVKVVDSANVQTGFNTSIIVIAMIFAVCAGAVWFVTKRKID